MDITFLVLLSTAAAFLITQFSKTSYGARLFYRVPKRLRILIPSAVALLVGGSYALAAGMSWGGVLALCTAGPLASYFFQLQKGGRAWWEEWRLTRAAEEVARIFEDVSPEDLETAYRTMQMWDGTRFSPLEALVDPKDPEDDA